MLLQIFLPQTVDKVARPGGGLEWSDIVMQLVLELLPHCTPPSCISSNILSVAKVILQKTNVINQLPGVEYIHLCQVTLSYPTNLFVFNELARPPKFLEQHEDGKSRGHKEFQKKYR